MVIVLVRVTKISLWRKLRICINDTRIHGKCIPETFLEFMSTLNCQLHKKCCARLPVILWKRLSSSYVREVRPIRNTQHMGIFNPIQQGLCYVFDLYKLTDLLTKTCQRYDSKNATEEITRFLILFLSSSSGYLTSLDHNVKRCL